MKAVSGVDEQGRPRDGSYSERFKNGNLACEGEFSQGLKTGVWTYYLANGNLKAQGSYSKDTIVGDWRWYRDNGELMQTGSFDADGDKQGLWRRYHPNGKLMDEGRFDGGKKTGVWTTYDECGAPKGSRNFG